MYILGVINQLKNLFLKAWGVKIWKSVIIVCIAGPFVLSFTSSTLNSLINRGMITLPTAIQAMVVSANSHSHSYQQAPDQQQSSNNQQQAPDQQQSSNNQQQQKDKGGTRITYTFETAGIMIAQHFGQALLICGGIFLLYKLFPAKTVQPPMLHSRRKVNE